MPKGHFERSEEHRKHISEALRGKKKSDEHKQKISEVKSGVKWTEEAKAAIAGTRTGSKSALFGKVYDEAHCKRMSDARIGVSWNLKRHGITVDQYTEQVASGNRWCFFGKHWAPKDNFSKTRTYCHDCRMAVNRKRILYKKYKVTEEWYASKMEEQGGGCAICGSTNPGAKRQFLPIDHCHKSGSVRGILCIRCNMFIGQIESAGILDKTMAYLARYATA